MSDKKLNLKYVVCLPIALILFAFLWFFPIEPVTVGSLTFGYSLFFGDGVLSQVEVRVIALFVLAAMFWIFEIIPTWCTSTMIIVLMLLTVSDQAAFTFASDANVGSLVSYKSILATFAEPTVMLFLGGFALALCATKVGLDAQLARILMAPFGTNPKMVLLGFLMVIGLFSMFMSNTATAAMMLAFLAPVLRSLPDEGSKIGLALAIPIAANIGGIGTPIGTPPNTIALKYLNEPSFIETINGKLAAANESLGTAFEPIARIGFPEWCSVMVPFAIVMLLISWAMLLVVFPFKVDKIELKIEGKPNKDKSYWIVVVTFIVTVFLWMTEKLHGLNSYVVAMIPVGVFAATGVLGKKELKSLDWDVLWMVAGGFALGLGLNKTGLAAHLVEAIPFGQWMPLLVLVVASLLAYALSNFISHSAASALLIPILAAVATGMAGTPGFEGMGGAATLIVTVAVTCSLAMLFPISTPPNAIAHSTGLIKTKDMALTGAIIGGIGIVLLYLIMMFIGLPKF